MEGKGRKKSILYHCVTNYYCYCSYVYKFVVCVHIHISRLTRSFKLYTKNQIPHNNTRTGNNTKKTTSVEPERNKRVFKRKRMESIGSNVCLYLNVFPSRSCRSTCYTLVSGHIPCKWENTRKGRKKAYKVSGNRTLWQKVQSYFTFLSRYCCFFSPSRIPFHNVPCCHCDFCSHMSLFYLVNILQHVVPHTKKWKERHIM